METPQIIKKLGVIDMTPSWASMLPLYLLLLEDGKPEAKEEVKAELLKMAQLADSSGKVQDLEFTNKQLKEHVNFLMGVLNELHSDIVDAKYGDDNKTMILEALDEKATSIQNRIDRKRRLTNHLIGKNVV